jgi:formate/nitrite transporter FocA (FNT family)
VITSAAIPIFFGEQFLWQPRNLPTNLMVGSLHFAMGLIMILVAKKPLENKSFIDFVFCAIMLHALVMIIFAQKSIHTFLDSLFIGIMGVIPVLIYPWPLRSLFDYRNLKD